VHPVREFRHGCGGATVRLPALFHPCDAMRQVVRGEMRVKIWVCFSRSPAAKEKADHLSVIR